MIFKQDLTQGFRFTHLSRTSLEESGTMFINLTYTHSIFWAPFFRLSREAVKVTSSILSWGLTMHGFVLYRPRLAEVHDSVQAHHMNPWLPTFLFSQQDWRRWCSASDWHMRPYQRVIWWGVANLTREYLVRAKQVSNHTHHWRYFRQYNTSHEHDINTTRLTPWQVSFLFPMPCILTSLIRQSIYSHPVLSHIRSTHPSTSPVIYSFLHFQYCSTCSKSSITSSVHFLCPSAQTKFICIHTLMTFHRTQTKGRPWRHAIYSKFPTKQTNTEKKMVAVDKVDLIGMLTKKNKTWCGIMNMRSSPSLFLVFTSLDCSFLWYFSSSVDFTLSIYAMWAGNAFVASLDYAANRADISSKRA